MLQGCWSYYQKLIKCFWKGVVGELLHTEAEMLQDSKAKAMFSQAGRNAKKVLGESWTDEMQNKLKGIIQKVP